MNTFLITTLNNFYEIKLRKNLSPVENESHKKKKKRVKPKPFWSNPSLAKHILKQYFAGEVPT